MRPVICMITARRRLGGDVTELIARVGAAARAGVDLVQVRERDLEGRALTELVASCVEGVRGTRTRIIVNDRLDVALASGAHGVHLRADSFLPERARAIAPAGFLVGRSVHGVDDALRATRSGSVDYLIFGTVFDTTSKPDRDAAGTGAVADVARTTTIPVLAIGGITAQNAREVARAGAAGVAAIGLFADQPMTAFDATLAALRGAFDGPPAGNQ
jgi:thiamine-phosphate diphosphorylase